MRIKHPREHGLVVARGGAVDPTTIAPGTTGQVLTATTGADPAFAAPAAVSLTTGVTGVLPLANGGTNSAVGAVAIMQFIGTAVGAGATVFLGRDDDASENNIRFRSPVAGLGTALVSQSAVAPGGTDTFTYTLRVDAADTALTFVVTGASATGNLTGASVAIALAHRLSVKLVTSATAAVTDHMVTLAIQVTGVS